MTVRRSSVIAHYQHIVRVLDHRHNTLHKFLPVLIGLCTVLFVFIPLIVNIVLVSNKDDQGLVDFQRLAKAWVPHGIDNLGSPHLNFSSVKISVNREGPACIEKMRNDLISLINITHSSPTLVRRIFNRLRLEDWFPAERQLEDILSSPQPILPLIAEITSCASRNVFLSTVACKLLEKDAVRIRDDVAWVKELVVALHIILVTDRVTQSAIHDISFALDLLDHVSSRYDKARSGSQSAEATVGPDSREFRKDKTDSVKMGFAFLTELRMKGPRSFTLQEQHRVEMIFQLNILEAVIEDKQRQKYSNSNAGLVLADYIMGKGSLASILPDAFNRKFSFHVGKPFADMYVSWNAAFIFSQFASHSPELTALKLFTPSVVCTERDVGASGWLEGRVISLWLSLSGTLYTADSEFVDLVQNNIVVSPQVVDGWGDVNLGLNPFETPSLDHIKGWMDRLKSTMQGFGYELPRYSVLSYVAGVDYPWVMTTLTWAACLLLGFSTEMLVAKHVLPGMKEQTATMWWKFAQVAYSFLMGIAVFSRSVFGLPFMVIGLFKCGLPETIGYLAAALRPGITWREYTTNMLNGIGLVLHHLAVSWMITGTCTGFTVQDRFLVSTQVPLLVQHLLIILRYHSYTTYCILILIVEAWWQLEITFQLTDVRPPWHWWVASIMILIGHWFFIASYIIEWILSIWTGQRVEHHKNLSDVTVVEDTTSFGSQPSFGSQADEVCVAALSNRPITGDMVYMSGSTPLQHA